MVLQLKEVLEPFVERLDRSAPALVQPAAFTAFVKPDAALAPVIRVLARITSAAGSGRMLVPHEPANRRADITATAAAALLIVLDALTVFVLVIAAVHEHISHRRRQVCDLLAEGSSLMTIGGIHRGQQRKDRRILGGCDDHLIPITIDPTIMFAVAPARIPIAAAWRRAIGARTAHRTSSGDQALVGRNRLGVCNALAQGLLALQTDRNHEKAMRATIPIEVRA